MIPDRHDRDRALDPSRSFIVEAPAGSGKTGLLVQRYLRLLGTVDRPESIVAMTFTRKAAAEMKERIHAALLEASNGQPADDEYRQQIRKLAMAALERDRKFGWNLVSDTGRLQIQTIDSICAMLTRHMPVVSEFGGVGKVIENAGELYRLAARRMLGKLTETSEENAELFRRVSLHFDNDIARVERQVARMLEQRDQWRSLVYQEDSQLVDDFRRLLEEAHEALRIIFRERSSVDFTEVTRAAIKALGAPEQPTDLLYWLDYRIEHLLVDEFQDTSRAQYDLIKALTEQWSESDGHTLFLVSDPMQSIYRFREAEVSLFLRCWEDRQLGSVRLEPLRLTTNFRSTPEIVEWTEATFAPIMTENNVTESAVKLRPAQADRSRSKTKPQLIPLIDDDGEQEAREIIRILERGPKEGTTAILVRSRSHIKDILPALRRSGIRYEAIEIDALEEEQHILDLISLTRALVHVGDRVSWLACLRAPWCGLTLSDLSSLAESESERTIFDLLSDPTKIAALSPDGRSRALGAHEILSAAIASVGRLPLRDLVEQTWLALGGPAALREPNQLEDAETFLNLIAEFDTGGIIRDFSLLEERLECLYARPSAAAGRVQVMTIHQAKGLEFDTVIIPHLGKGAKSSERELLVWVEGPDGLAIAAQPQQGGEDSLYDQISEVIKKKEEHELKRLFYVGCTRAINRLYLLGSVKLNKNRTGFNKASSSTFLGLIWNSVLPHFTEEFSRRAPAQANLFDVVEQPRTLLRRLPANWRAPILHPSVNWQPQFQRATASGRTITYDWVSDTSRHVGTVVHEFLKRAAGTRLDVAAPLIKSELLRLGVSRSEEPKASAQVMQALRNTFASERGRWILQPHREARSEWAIAGRIQDQVITGAIDRVFRDEEDRLWIIDFKTSSHEGARVEAFLSEEQRRYRTQLDNYATLLARMEKGPIWLGLYFPLLDGWREWQFEAAAELAGSIY
ncbi:MAG TPA: UvrD-helicase domain-containing protein [Bryobacteraceae bacterium]|nr:UvrD-helicase domain-containing protein [Bryobacteraceae bacterium]